MLGINIFGTEMKEFYTLIFLMIIESTAFKDDSYCAPYRGHICKNYISSSIFVYFANGSSGSVHEQITTNLWNEMIVGLKEPCQSAAEVTRNKLKHF